VYCTDVLSEFERFIERSLQAITDLSDAVRGSYSYNATGSCNTT
jgi:hypothetical protein